MIDFQNASFFKLSKVEPHNYDKLIRPILIPGESIVSAYKAMRDGVVFTNRRIIAINIQGVTGKKKDITSLPYGKIQTFSIETAGVLDLDAELQLWFSGLGVIKLEFASGEDIIPVCQLISSNTL